MTDWIVIAILATAFVDGCLCTRELVAIHRAIEPPRNRITFAFMVVAIVCTSAAGYYGFLGARRLLGLEQIPGAAILSILVASAVLFLPRFLRWTVRRAQAGR